MPWPDHQSLVDITCVTTLLKFGFAFRSNFTVRPEPSATSISGLPSGHFGHGAQFDALFMALESTDWPVAHAGKALLQV